MASYFARKVTGTSKKAFDGMEDEREYFCEFNKRKIHLKLFEEFVQDRVSVRTVMKTREMSIIRSHGAALALISAGQDMWDSLRTNRYLQELKENYLLNFSSLPVNTQFVERGVKSSNYVTIGRRKEASRSIWIMARGKALPEGLQKAREEIRDKNDEGRDQTIQVQGKKKRLYSCSRYIVIWTDLKH